MSTLCESLLIFQDRYSGVFILYVLCMFCRHTRLKHSNTTEKTCDICGKEFTKPSYVKKHKFMKHDVYDPSVKVGSVWTTTRTSGDYLPPSLVSQQRSLTNQKVDGWMDLFSIECKTLYRHT